MDTQAVIDAAGEAKPVLPAPYYDRDGITIYHGDCRVIVPSLPQVDLLLTDPPYGIEYQSAWRIDWQRKPKIQGDDEFPLWLFDLEPRHGTLVWCRWDILTRLPQPKSFIVWDKGRHSMGDLKHEFGRQWEACAFYPGPQHQFKRRPVDVIRCDCVPPARLVHPCEKPLGAIRPLIAAHPSETLLDPYMGSGATLIAAKLERRRAIGIEIEEKYCEIAAERLRQRVLF